MSWRLVVGIVAVIIIVFSTIFLLTQPGQPAATSQTQTAGNNPFGTPPANAPSNQIVTSTTISDTPTDAEYAAPDQLAGAFYTWYVARYGSTASRSTVTSHLALWLTPNFEANWQTTLDNSDVDPFLLTQDAFPADSTITPIIVNQSPATSTVSVQVSSSVGSVTYTVTLLKLNDQWRIDAINHS